MQASEKTVGFLRTAKLLYRSQGVGRFYRGALSIALGCIPAHSAFFGVYELVKKYSKIEDGVMWM